MAKLVGTLLVTTSLLGSNPDDPQNSYIGDISKRKNGQDTVARLKNVHKMRIKDPAPDGIRSKKFYNN